MGHSITLLIIIPVYHHHGGSIGLDTWFELLLIVTMGAGRDHNLNPGRYGIVRPHRFPSQLSH